MIKDFEGKVVVITGGASGIGLGLATVFAKHGMKLVLGDINKEALDKVAKDFNERDVEVMTVVTDVSDPEQVAHLAEVSYERYGHVNILCNNAGIGAGGPLRYLTKEDWNWILGVNLYGVIYGIQSFLDRMLTSREPCHIVNTSSLAGLTPGDSGPYSASKSAVVALSERLALECFNTNVSVSVVCPAFVRSNIVENTFSLSERREGLWQPPPVMTQSSSSELENSKKLIELGMDPEVMAEMVIKAIENDILYVITHPEYIPMIKSRFENMLADTERLHEGLKYQKGIKSNTFRNDSPAFTFTYPDYFIEVNPNPISKAIFAASYADSNIEINVSKVSPKRKLEELPKKIVRPLKMIAKEIEIVSNKATSLKDGTPAYETIIELKVVGVFKTKMMYISVIKDEKWIRVSISAAANNLNEKLRDIVYSLEFH
ncbi:MAG: SDR family NAD(P)-dependent oxidoreductase [Promethearchaeota archaeon]|jgi:NAD(P)-dependent dehydrogenase (short-subunit alcohol dehydrogenase family)